MQQSVTVEREHEFSYQIHLQESFAALPDLIKKEGLTDKRICIVTDTHVEPLYGQKVLHCLREAGFLADLFVMEAGEANKHLDTVQKLYEYLIQNHYERKDLLLALGGGVVGDLTGFAAATYLRGIAFIQVPTTLLSQVDSSIGGKTGVDFKQYKNMVGAFHQPRMVYMNLKTLDTLPPVEFACGMGEVLKSALIRDESYYQWLLAQAARIEAREFPILTEMIVRCCKIKRQVVEEDPKEQGVRAILNFGHTIGHAVEKLKDFQLLHGQCVAVGTIAAGKISLDRGLLSPEEFSLIERGNDLFHLPKSIQGLKAEDILAATKKDKKMAGGKIRFILLHGIGNACIDTSLAKEEILAGIAYILEKDAEK